MSKTIRKVSNTVGGFLGLKGPQTQAYGGPSNYYTPHSSSIDGNVTIDPSIRRLQDEGLNRANAIYGDIGNATDRYLGNANSIRGSFGDLGKDFRSIFDSLNTNNGALIQARVNPVLRNFASLRGSTQQNLGDRGLSGSSFADQSMRNIETDASTAEGDARAIATQESLAGRAGALSGISQTLSAQLGIDESTLNATFQKASMQAGLNNENYQVAATRLQQELASLGLSSQQIQQSINAWAQNQQNNLSGYLGQTGRIGTIGKIAGDVPKMFNIGGI